MWLSCFFSRLKLLLLSFSLFGRIVFIMPLAFCLVYENALERSQYIS